MVMEGFRDNSNSTADNTTAVLADTTSENYLDSTSVNISHTTDLEIVQMVIIVTFPVILVIGSTGNVLTFVVMQRGSLKHSSTCFYMAMLAVADTGESAITSNHR